MYEHIFLIVYSLFLHIFRLFIVIWRDGETLFANRSLVTPTIIANIYISDLRHCTPDPAVAV